MDRLNELNIADEERAIALIAPVIERAPHIAKRVVENRPFESTDDLRDAIRAQLLGLSKAEQIDLFRLHPELSPDNPLAMTTESQSEQGRLKLTAQKSEFQTRLSNLNARYQEKFGFPFITALVRHKDVYSVLEEFETRLEHDRCSEMEQAIDQIAMVSSSRVQASFGPSNTASPKLAVSRT